MAILYPHKDVENYFVTLDFPPTATSQLQNVVKLYEAGKVILLNGARIEFDQKFFDSVQFPKGQKDLEKFKSNRFVDEYFSKMETPPELLDSCFRGDLGRLRYFAEQVRSVNQQVRAIADRLFTNYRYLNNSITWRLTETLNENLHVDVYREDLPNHHLRIFVNLDSIHRIWHTSFSLEYILANYLCLLDPDFVRSATPGRICRELNMAVFGGWESAGREGRPKHISFFEPGEVWVVDSRKVSHQIFYGRRAVSTEFAVDNASMDDSSTHYYSMVERHRQAFLSLSGRLPEPTPK